MPEQIKHHLTPDILMAYSAGTLPEAFNLIVATHLSICDHCRAEAESFDAVGGAVLDDMPGAAAALEPHALEATMALIAGGPVTQAAPLRTPAPDAVLPAPLRAYVGSDLRDVKWTSAGMGVRQAILKTSPQASARLLYIPAGAAMPDHGHKGMEMTLVLQGAFQDDADYFARGDVEIADSDTHHTPVADIHEDCICLAVTDAKLRFKGLIPRLAQPFLRI